MPMITRATLTVGAIGAAVLGAAALFIVPKVHEAKLRHTDERLAPQRKEFRDRLQAIRLGVLDPTSRIAVVPLKEGDNAVGSDEHAAIRLSADALASYGGLAVLSREHQRLTLQAQPPVSVSGVLPGPDQLHNGDVLLVGRVTLLVRGLPDAPTVAVHDPQAPGRDHSPPQLYATNSEFTIPAKLSTYVIKMGSAAPPAAGAQPQPQPQPKDGHATLGCPPGSTGGTCGGGAELKPPPIPKLYAEAKFLSASEFNPIANNEIPMIEVPIGTKVPRLTVELLREETEMHSLGKLNFTVKGKPYSMEAYSIAAPHVILLFKDRTNGQSGGTFSGGRLVDVDVRDDNTAEVDFNQAYNLPCAFSKLYVCPEVPKSNEIDAEVPAGELAFAGR